MQLRFFPILEKGTKFVIFLFAFLDLKVYSDKKESALKGAGRQNESNIIAFLERVKVYIFTVKVYIIAINRAIFPDGHSGIRTICINFSFQSTRHFVSIIPAAS